MEPDHLVVEDALRTNLERLLAEEQPRFVLEGQPGSGRRTTLSGLICADGVSRLLVVDLLDAWRATPPHARHIVSVIADVLREVFGEYRPRYKL